MGDVAHQSLGDVGISCWEVDVWSGLTWTWARAGYDMARRAAVDGNEVGGHRRWGGVYSPAVAGSHLRWDGKPRCRRGRNWGHIRHGKRWASGGC